MLSVIVPVNVCFACAAASVAVRRALRIRDFIIGFASGEFWDRPLWERVCPRISKC